MMVNGSSNAIDKINGTIFTWTYDFLTISSNDSIDLIEETWKYN
ncbi:hypothetical protein ALNOE001_20920 [Candidatus Methanobinarius endosymbioticus]|uniref:Uncharacterized protein n=1 Tax=Candidatus Methanobinarius endosymbioticus TaxID=2006182 RepID=A0A366M9W8_9EURY|nr:hypothetical protein ALNOE001_20920 [Candidatus Methanobinarius endosymbioticus]